jgi:hypothetical protein
MSAQSFALNASDMSFAIALTEPSQEQTKKNPILKIRSLVNNDKLGFTKNDDGTYTTVMCPW